MYSKRYFSRWVLISAEEGSNLVLNGPSPSGNFVFTVLRALGINVRVSDFVNWAEPSERARRPRVVPSCEILKEQARARREIEAGDRPAPPLDHRFLEDIEELL